MPFTYQPILVDRRVIGDLLLRRGQIAAQGAERVGDIAANAERERGAILGNTIQTIGNTLSRLPDQIQQNRDLETQRAFQQQQLGEGALRLSADTHLAAGQRAMAGMMAGDQLPGGDVGPRQQSYVGADGLFDVPKITTALGQMGFGDKAADLVKGAESINDSVLKANDLQRKAADAHTVMLGDMAAGVQKLRAIGMPTDQALDFVAQPGLATKRFDPQEYAQVRNRLLSLPPQQQEAALANMMDQAAQLAPTKNLAEGATEVDRYGRSIAKGIEKPPTEAELALKAAQGDQTAAAALAKLKPGPQRSETLQALDAYAKSLGKTKAEDLSYAEMRQFEKEKNKVISDQAFLQHQRERQYDIANPIPVKGKSQPELEQEYRTALLRGVSSRSGGLGLEDQKVQQANHLLALLDQNYDPKTNTYSLPKTLQGELAAGLARLVAPGGNVGIEMMREFDQRTAKGDLAGALSYVTGHPFPSATEDFAKLLKDSIQRQGEVAQQNREGEMGFIRGLAPTDLEESRRTALETNMLNPLRLSRVIQDNSTGQRRLQISTDGGKTWR